MAALALRDEVAPESMENDACRLIFSEADGLPGIVVDRYNDLIILQLLTQGTAQDDVRRVVAEAVKERFAGGITVWERPDAKVRELEQLAAPAAGPVYSDDADSARLVRFLRSMGCVLISMRGLDRRPVLFLISG